MPTTPPTPETDPETWPCTWLIEGYGEDGLVHDECGAATRYRPDGSGYDCATGHEHTYAEARQAQGWDYAADEGEAFGLARAGVEPREMDGHIWPA